MLLHDVARASAEVGHERSRTAKTGLLADVLRRAAATGDPEVLCVVVAYLSGELRQRRTGLGPASLRGGPPPADSPSLGVLEVDAAFEQASLAAGTGSAAARREVLHGLLARATADEQHLLGGLVTGELRQGAQQGVLTDAVVLASAAPDPAVRRALTLAGDLAAVAVAALLPPESGGGLEAFALQVGRPLSPMLAQSAPDLDAALERTGPAAVEWKLDGIRVQVHRDGDDVRVFTRSLDDVTDRLPEVVADVRSLAAERLVLDGEVIALHPDGRPRPFQETASRTGTRAGVRGTAAAATTPLTTYLFDALHVDGRDVLDDPLPHRRAVLEALGRPDLLVPQHVVGDGPEGLAAARAFAADALDRGHEGVVVKALDAPYAMGRRGAGWVKVKPVHTLDLVVLAAEWGHGRRTGRLSNLHLGARDPDGAYGEPGGFVMLGKTFKGMTDEMLAWQTERFLSIADGPTDGYVVRVRPEQVVEIAFDGLQRSTRYPAALALRFARVLRYRDDKTADEADTIQGLGALLP